MKHIDIKSGVNAGKHLTIQFRAGIEEAEDYAAPGMRANIIAVDDPDADGVFKVTFDFGPFESHNAALEKRVYYLRGVSGHTAREAGCYHAIDRYYFGSDDDLPFEVIGDLRAWRDYQSEPRSMPYVEWLEAHYNSHVAKS